MTKTISAKKKFKKCLRINTVLSCEGMCEGMESMGGGAKGNNLKMTASTAIDPMPLPTSLPGDDKPFEACNNRDKRSIPASHVIPAKACARAWNLWEAVQKVITLA